MKQEKPENSCLIVCNGELRKWLLDKFLDASLSLSIVACDGSSDFLYKYKITPDYIIGDLDSIQRSTLAYFKRKKVSIKKIPNQNLTDFEKAIRFAISKKFKNIFVTGFSGKRLDHTISSISVLKKYCKKAHIKIYDDIFESFYVNKSVGFDYKKGATVSLFALPKATGIKTEGLKWKLNRETLELGVREGVSNAANADYVKIELNKGDLMVFKKHFGKITIPPF